MGIFKYISALGWWQQLVLRHQAPAEWAAVAGAGGDMPTNALPVSTGHRPSSTQRQRCAGCGAGALVLVPSTGARGKTHKGWD